MGRGGLGACGQVSAKSVLFLSVCLNLLPHHLYHIVFN